MVVLDGFASGDANIKDESGITSDTRKVIESETCYITPLGLAETYLYLRNSVSTACADAVLDMVLENKSVKVADDRDPTILRDAIPSNPHTPSPGKPSDKKLSLNS